jgi:hypothetical protein
MNICIIEKVVTGQIVGDGVKRTPAYETPLTKHDLDKWRKEFWGKLNINKFLIYAFANTNI